MVAPISEAQARAALEAVQTHGGIRPACKATGMCFGTMRNRYERAKQMELDLGGAPVIDVEPVVRGRVHALPREQWDLPPAGKVNRYIFTCAQNNTNLHEPTWRNLQALAAHYGASIHISTFTYDLASYGASSVKRGKAKQGDGGEPWWPSEVLAHVLDQPVVVAPGLVWCGEMNILPTAARPLSGFESYTGRKSGIFPHVKFAMESIASGKFEPTKFNYTTGTITQRNYIAKKAGLKAEFHHGYGGLLVEVDSDGDWFVRQLNADSDGTIYDLSVCARDGRVSLSHRVEAITWGDIHVGTVSPQVEAMLWGAGGMMDALKPRHQFLHDVLDFRSRNHHDARDPHKLFQKYVDGADDVVDELRSVARFICETAYRDWCQTLVVDSNHNNALTRWLREADYRVDPKNAIFFLDANLQVYRSILNHTPLHLLEWSINQLDNRASRVRFLRQDESFVICHDANGGIECGMHGHLGPNGSRGSAAAFAKMGRKSIIGHGHGAFIHDGCWQDGVTGSLDQGYNAGPSNWSCSHVVAHPNGKRQMITCWSGKWRAV